jgi:hypothetical protein
VLCLLEFASVVYISASAHLALSISPAPLFLLTDLESRVTLSSSRSTCVRVCISLTDCEAAVCVCVCVKLGVCVFSFFTCGQRLLGCSLINVPPLSDREFTDQRATSLILAFLPPTTHQPDPGQEQQWRRGTVELQRGWHCDSALVAVRAGKLHVRGTRRVDGALSVRRAGAKR